MNRVFRFEATIRGGRGGGADVEVPFSIREVFGTGGQVRVLATFDGHEYRGSVAPMGGGVHSLGVRKDVRAAIGKDVGDPVSVTIQRDDAPRTVEIPSELAVTLAGAPLAAERFDSLSYTHRREFAEWVAGAKKQETKDRRAAKAVAMILEGKSL